MGILNVTPDSFFDGGVHSKPEKAIEKGLEMVKLGAHFIDIGGESSRPFSEPVSEKEELKRVIPVIHGLAKMCSIPLSIDTIKPSVAKAAVEQGARIINDITGLSDPEMRQTVKETKVKAIVMHMQGTPKTMQVNPSYPKGVVTELIDWFKKRVEFLVKEGIDEGQIILDPGIGFGKTIEQNLEIIDNLNKIKALGFPLLIGLSRKSFMTKILRKPPSDLLPSTIGMNTIALMNGADILRVHDVAEHCDVVNLMRTMG